MILKCTCENEFQDKEYGKFMRVHNPTLKSPGNIFRCTICLKERGLSGEEVKKSKSKDSPSNEKGKKKK